MTKINLSFLNYIMIKTFAKTLLVMLLCLVVGFQATAQKSTYVTVDISDGSLKSVIEAIEKQTPYVFSYRDDVVAMQKAVTIRAKRQPVTKVLDKVLSGTGLTYEIVSDKSIIITRKASKKEVRPANRKINIRGRVVGADGEPLVGASVLVDGTDIGVATDIDGNYSLVNVPDDATVTVSYIGCVPQSIKADNSKSLSEVCLNDDNNLLDEIVVVGYGTQKKINLTGSVATVNAKDIQEIPTANLTQALAGRLSGVRITQTAGKPGGNSDLSIRAAGTWNSTSPLYVIDGVVRDKFAFDGIDANDIENLSVLKDGASAAIYGSRAANGVVLVTTKKGQDGKPVINYTGSVGWENATKIPDMMDAYENAKFINESYRWNNIPLTDNRYITDDELQYFKEHPYSMLDESWRDPANTRHSLSVSGGNNRVRYFIAGNYFYQTGSFDNLSYNKYSVRSNLEATVVKGLTLSLGMSTDTRNDRKPYWQYDYDNDSMGNLYNGILRRGIFASYIDGLPNGTYLKWHPIEVINGVNGYNKKRYSNYELSASAQWDIPWVRGLSLKLAVNSYQRNTFLKQFNRPYDLYVFKTTGQHNHIQTNELDYVTTRNDGDFLYESTTMDRSYQLNAMATYNRTFGKHDVNALFVYEQAESNTDWMTGQRNYFISTAVDQLFAGSSDQKNSSVNGSGSESGRKSYVGRISYGFDNRYLVELSFRYDGSVNFSPKRRWGFFPSASLAWRISQERFFSENIQLINNLKLRGSVGKLGNDAVGGWQWMQRYNLTTGAYFGTLSNGVSAGSIPNVDITWEKSTDIDYGFDLAMLRNRLNFSINGFYKHTYDILGSRLASLPTTFGGTMPAENYATINTKGFEIETSWQDRINQNFSYRVGGNVGYAVNKLIEMDEPQNQRDYQRQVGYNTDRAMGYICTGMLRTQADVDALPEGFTIFGHRPEPGMLIFKDIRGADSDEPDGKIDSNDQEYIIKHTTPPWSYGFNLGATWKGISVDAFFQGVAGGHRFYDSRDEWAELEATAYAWRSDYWTPENTDARFPHAGYDETTSVASSFWIQDTSYLRLKNLNVSYALPTSIIGRLGVEQLKVFFNGTNLFLIQDKIKCYDPENSSIMNYPLMRSYSFGLNISF